ncbi:hypothetical protein BGX34_008348 [Mortierella sp. NVP85]|nr:hypothetical protein BGX34_008348 [Mortierella sp. NVP85]
MFTTTNFRYLRVSKTSVLPLNLSLSKEDLDWFNERSFQEVLTVLKPLLLSRIELHDQGHIFKRAVPPSTSVNVHQDLDDGLEDAGIILGGSDDGIGNQGSEPTTGSTGGSDRTHGKKRKGRGVSGGNKPFERPQFAIRYGMRPSTAAERGGAILIAEKNLGFLKIKKEQGDVSILTEEASGSQRLTTNLASLEGERMDSEEAGVVIREEDESDNLRVTDFQRGDDDDTHGTIDDGDYAESIGDKRKQSENEPRPRGKGKRTKTDESDAPSSQMDQKPTLQVKYAPLKLHPQTLYIVIHTLKATAAATSSSEGVTSGSATEACDVSDSAIAEQQEEEEGSLFPPGLDYFLS